MPAPVSNPTITCDFHVRGTHWAAGYHTGRDYRAVVGTPVTATRAGTVIAVSTDASYGHSVTVDSSGVHHLYAHLSQQAVGRGQVIGAGQRLGLSGATGNVTGPHLHYEERVTPFAYLNHRAPEFDLDAGAPGPTVWWQRLVFGTQDSDSVRAMQARLNAVLGTHLPLTGNYLDQTREAVAEFQRRQGWSGANADGLIYVPALSSGGKVTVSLLFPHPPYTVHWGSL
ncbi:MAG: peptidoglycan DD-metalloendopeptidase family protein [Lapillicoccus sp.]